MHLSKLVFSLLLLFILALTSQPLQAQCDDIKVSGVFTYCNSFNNGNPVTGYFVGFRVVDPTGDTLNVVDLDGGATMNRGKRVNLVGDLEPANITTAPLRISGTGGDTTEYWYFGPYANGASFNIALIDPDGVCDTIFIASGTYDCADNTGISDPSACAPPNGSDPPVPLYFLDFTNSEFNVGFGPFDNPEDNKFYIMTRTREQTCCDVGGNNIRCMELIVRLTENDFGLGIDDEGSGNTAGKLYADSLNGFTCTGNTNLTYPFQQGGGESNDSPLCFTGIEARDFIVLSCKAGGNATYLTVGTLSGVISTSSALTQENCPVGLNVYNATSAVWSSPDDPNLDNLQSCQIDSVYCSFLYNNDVFGPITNCADTFTYIIGGYPLPESCLPLDTLLYDTTQVIVFPEFDVEIDLACTMDPDSVTLTATIVPGLPDCNYVYTWSNGSTAPSITVLISNNAYSVTVTRPEPKFASAICNPATASIIANPDFIPSIPNDTICDGQSTTIQFNNPLPGVTNYFWNFGSGATPDTASGIGPHTVQYDLNPENEVNGAYITLTISRDGCAEVTDTVSIIRLNPLPTSAINADTTPVCYYTDKTFQPMEALIPGASYVWNFGMNAVPSSASGYGPHNVQYTSAGLKTVKLIIYPNQAGAQCPDSSTISFNILSCPAQALGYVKSIEGAPIQNVILKLYADANLDGVADNTIAVRTVSTSGSGIYAMASVTPGHYVIVQTQPSGWVTQDDFDATNDGDLVNNISGTDNLIPASLYASEIDSMNNFIEAGQPASIMGYVFTDDDVDNFPDEGEGVDSVELKLYADNNTDGIADSNAAVDSILTAADGSFHFDSVNTGHYVLVEINRSDYISFLDVDASNDGDAVPNSNMNNDTIPVTIFNGELDAQNFFMDGLLCPLMVTNHHDEGYGSFRYNLECSQPGDTIQFHPVMAGDIIHSTTSCFVIDKDLHILSSITPRISISSNVLKLFDVLPNVYVELSNLDLISGDGTSEGAALDNMGEVKLDNISIIKNPNFPQVQFLIRNHPGSILEFNGNCLVDY